MDDSSGPHSHQNTDPSLGTVFNGRFRIERLLGRGSMGAVYEATQLGVDRRVALKIMSGEVDDTAMLAKRFHQEARLSSQLEHPNTIRVLDFGLSSTGHLYLAMELLKGRTLSEAMKARGPLTIDDVLHITRQIAKSLAEAHSKGIVHRDLKPDNIFLKEVYGEPLFVKVLDFGIARTYDDENYEPVTQAGFIVGTIRYMSPEQARGKALDGRSDLYAVGVIMYQMLTGQRLYDADSFPEFLDIIVMGRLPERPKSLPNDPRAEPLVDLIYQCLSLSPEDRPKNAEALIDGLARVARSIGGVRGHRPGPSGAPQGDTTLPSVRRPPPIPTSIGDDMPAPTVMLNPSEAQPETSLDPRATIAAPLPRPVTRDSSIRPAPKQRQPAPADKRVTREVRQSNTPQARRPPTSKPQPAQRISPPGRATRRHQPSTEATGQVDIQTPSKSGKWLLPLALIGTGLIVAVVLALFVIDWDPKPATNTEPDPMATIDATESDAGTDEDTAEEERETDTSTALTESDVQETDTTGSTENDTTGGEAADTTGGALVDELDTETTQTPETSNESGDTTAEDTSDESGDTTAEDTSDESGDATTEDTVTADTKEQARPRVTLRERTDSHRRARAGLEALPAPSQTTYKVHLIATPRASVYEGRRRLGRTPIDIEWTSPDPPPSLRLRRGGHRAKTLRLKVGQDGQTLRVQLQRARRTTGDGTTGADPFPIID